MTDCKCCQRALIALLFQPTIGTIYSFLKQDGDNSQSWDVNGSIGKAGHVAGVKHSAALPSGHTALTTAHLQH